MELDIISAAANLGLAAVVAIILMLWKRQDDRRFQEILGGFLQRQETMIASLLQVVEANNRALSDVNLALREVRDFMDRVDRRLCGLEEAIRDAARGRTFR